MVNYHRLLDDRQLGTKQPVIAWTSLYEHYVNHGVPQIAGATCRSTKHRFPVLESEKKGSTHQGYYWVYYSPLTRSAVIRLISKAEVAMAPRRCYRTLTGIAGPPRLLGVYER